MRRFRIAAGILTMISMLFPDSGFVLCIAPGGHAAIEDINSECCAPSRNPVSQEGPQAIGSSPANNCENCTDILITPNDVGMAATSFKNSLIAKSPVVGYDGIGHLTSAAIGSTLRNCANEPQYTLIPITSAKPLRC